MIIINMCSCDECEEKFKDGKGESKKKRRGNDLESEVNIFPLVIPMLAFGVAGSIPTRIKVSTILIIRGWRCPTSRY
jgi:hypothetical protein